MATQAIVNELNEKIYDEGKIFWHENNGWSSKLWDRLSSVGWSRTKTSYSTIVFKDADGNKALDTGFTGMPQALKELAKLLM